MIAKAYEALTDPIARDNFQKYGNPDGRQALEMSIGLPAWLLEKQNQPFVIASYLLMILVVFPTSVLLLTANAAKSSNLELKAGASSDIIVNRRLFPDTEEIFRSAIRNGLSHPIWALEIVALAAEFRTLAYRSDEERKFVIDLRNQMARDQKFPLKLYPMLSVLKKQLPVAYDGNEKSFVLLIVHLTRMHASLTEELMDDLEVLLLKCPPLLRALVLHARVTCNAQVLVSCIHANQLMCQALMPTLTPVFQLPHVTVSDAERFHASVVVADNVDTFMRDLASAAFENHEMFQFRQDAKQQDDIVQYLKRLPIRTITAKIGTLKEKSYPTKSKKPKDTRYVFESDSAQGDMIHAVVRCAKFFKAKHADNTSSMASMTPFLPYTVKPEWFMVVMGGPNPKGFGNIVSGDAKITAFTIVEEEDDLNELVGEMIFSTVNNSNDWMGSADWLLGSTKLAVCMFSSVYRNLDVVVQLDLVLKDQSTLPEFKYHPDDVALENEPTSLYQMLQPQVVNEVDSDFEEEEEVAVKSAAAKKKNSKTKKQVKEESDQEEDDGIVAD